MAEKPTGSVPCRRTSCVRAAGSGTRGFCESDYRRQIRMGLIGWRDAKAARRHVALLRSLGWSYEQVAAEAEVSTWVVHKLDIGVTRRLRRESETALLAIQVRPHESQRSVDGTGTYRRCEALLWMAWPWPEIARRVGVAPYTLATLRTRREPVSYRVAMRVAAAYEELSHLHGPSKQTATKAQRAGYAPPAAWDEDSIDDPRARPAGIRRAS